MNKKFTEWFLMGQNAPKFWNIFSSNFNAGSENLWITPTTLEWEWGCVHTYFVIWSFDEWKKIYYQRKSNLIPSWVYLFSDLPAAQINRPKRAHLRCGSSWRKYAQSMCFLVNKLRWHELLSTHKYAVQIKEMGWPQLLQQIIGNKVARNI